MPKIKRICGNCCYWSDKDHQCFKEGTEGSYNPYNSVCFGFDPWENPLYSNQNEIENNPKKGNSK